MDKYTIEQTDRVSSGLDVAIHAPDGSIVAWVYNIDFAQKIIDALNA